MMSFVYKPFMLLVGNYGSGKTELALALARYCRSQTPGRVVLVDLDIVNPYFRSGEHARALRDEGIEVLMPSFAMSTVDIPALPAEMQSIFSGAFNHVIIDVGGDDTGAAALGRYHPQLKARRGDMQVLYVVNPFRPLSGSRQDITALFSLIEQRSRLRPDMLVNNANLQGQTTAQDLMDAQKLLQGVAGDLGIPIGMVAGEERLRAGLPPEMQALFFPISPVMKPEWLEE